MSTTTIESTTELKEDLIRVAKPHLKFLEPGSEINLELNFADAGLDSMSSINLLLDIEDELGIEIPDDLIEEDSFETLNSLLHLVLNAKETG